jgi:hypothetical protein
METRVENLTKKSVTGLNWRETGKIARGNRYLNMNAKDNAIKKNLK